MQPPIVGRATQAVFVGDTLLLLGVRDDKPEVAILQLDGEGRAERVGEAPSIAGPVNEPWWTPVSDTVLARVRDKVLIELLDVSDPVAPRVASSVLLDGEVASSSGRRLGVADSSVYACLADEDGAPLGLLSLDASDPYHPSLVTYLDEPACRTERFSRVGGSLWADLHFAPTGDELRVYDLHDRRLVAGRTFSAAGLPSGHPAIEDLRVGDDMIAAMTGFDELALVYADPALADAIIPAEGLPPLDVIVGTIGYGLLYAPDWPTNDAAIVTGVELADPRRLGSKTSQVLLRQGPGFQVAQVIGHDEDRIVVAYPNGQVHVVELGESGEQDPLWIPGEAVPVVTCE